MIRYEVELKGSEEKILVRCLPIDYRMAERYFGKSTSAMEKDTSIDEVGFVIHSAMKRDGQTEAASLDEFFKIFVDFDRKKADPKASPIQQEV